MQIISVEDSVKILKEPLRYEYIGSEKDFEGMIYDNIREICAGLGLPEIIAVERQKSVKLDDIQIRMDIIVRHTDDTITIFEVKKVNSKNPQCAHYAQVNAIGQLLLYKFVVGMSTGCDVRLVLVDNKIYFRTRCVFAEEKLPITLMEVQRNRVFIPYFGW